jgi:hypothetical protein
MLMALLTASVCPSVWGWNAELMSSVDPEARNNPRQNVEVKTGSRSETIETGIPWRRTISAKNTRTTDSAV